MNNTKQITLLEASIENINNTFAKITEFANQKGYRITGKMELPVNFLGKTKSLPFESKCQQKVVRNYINRLDKHIGMRGANLFLHFLFKRVLKQTDVPKIEVSEKEEKIQTLRKQWKKAFAESEKLRLAYKAEKGDFYKQKA